MNPFWSCAVTQFQFFLGSKSKDQKDVKQEKKMMMSKESTSGAEKKELMGNRNLAEGSSDPSEQLDAPKATAKREKSSSRKRRRLAVILPEQQLGEATKVSKAVSPSPRQLEAATDDHKAGVGDEVKFQTQMALALLTFSAGAIISAKGIIFAHQQAGQGPAVGGQAVNVPGFFFWWSIGLWFISLLVTTFTALVTSLRQTSPGLLFYAKLINAFSVCVSVAGVTFWIFS